MVKFPSFVIHYKSFHLFQKFKRLFAKNKKKWLYWKKKILRNVECDEANVKALKELGWKVLVVWECELKKDKVEQTLEDLYTQITSAL